MTLLIGLFGLTPLSGQNNPPPNNDIVPGYVLPPAKVEGILGPELTALAATYDPDGPPPSEFVYQIEDGQVLIEIVVLAGKYNALIAYLATYGISPNLFYDDHITTVDDHILVTLFFPISSLPDLAEQG